jgi:tetratricopeptide (TPR) repeat protein
VELTMELGNACLALGQSRGDAGMLRRARGAYQRALVLDPGLPEARLNLAYALTGEGSPAAQGQAWNTLTGLLRLSPGLVSAWEARSVVNLQAGRHLGALLDVNIALQCVKRQGGSPSAKAWMETTRAYVHGMVDDIGCQEKDLSMAMQAAPHDYEACFSSASVAMRRHEWKLAIEHFSTCLKTRPGNPPALLNRAVARIAYGIGVPDRKVLLHEASLAVEDTTLALQAAPNDANISFNRAVALQCLGRHEEASEDLSAVIKLEPNDARARLARMTSRRACGDNHGAVTDYKVALRLDEPMASAARR